MPHTKKAERKTRRTVRTALGASPFATTSSCRVVVLFHVRMCPIPLLVWMSTPGTRLNWGLRLWNTPIGALSLLCRGIARGVRMLRV